MNMIKDNFVGIMKFGGNQEYDAFFNVNGNRVKIVPLTQSCIDKIHKLNCVDGKEQTNGVGEWLYGFAEDNCSVAILRKTHFDIRITSGVDMKIAHFHSPLIVKSSIAGKEIDLKTFDSIEFYGGVVDILHNPDLAIQCRNGGTIIFETSENYTKKYEVEIDKEQFEVIYSVSMEELKLELGKVPDLKNAIHSIIKFKFQSPKQLIEIEKYYNYAMSLFQFCTRRINVCSQIRLYKNNIESPIYIRLEDGFADYSDDIDITRVIRFKNLHECFPKLLKILNEKATRPHLNFLPKQNKDIKRILNTNINDLCIAFEKEYSLSKTSVQETEKKAAKELAEYLENIVKKYEDCPEIVKNKAISLMTPLKSFSPSLKEKIICICKLYYQSAKAITEQLNHDNYGITTFYSDEEFEKKIAEFVRIRNSVSHSSVRWNDGVEIYHHLQLYIFINVLVRCGISPKSATDILSCMFNHLF